MTQRIATTAQEYYNNLVHFAYDGTFPSLAHGNDCMYRGDGTPSCHKRCAVGVQIPDEDYDARMEHGSLKSMPARFIQKVRVPEGLTLQDLQNIQTYCHDKVAQKTGGWGGWNAEIFIERLNSQPCFANVVKVHPKTAV
jgi:hypothetical protein